MVRISSWILLVFFVLPIRLWSQALDPYADSPGWYKPGHPLDSAEADSIKTLPGFKVEKVVEVPKEEGSLTSMTVDDEGRIYGVTQHQSGVFVFEPPELGSAKLAFMNRLGGAADDVGWAQGVLYAFDSLYVTISESNEQRPNGLYRLMDTNGNGVYDKVFKILELQGGGEHGPHNVVVGPRRRNLYMINGNGTPVPEIIHQRSTVPTDGYDHLLPDGFESSHFTDAGWVVRMKPDGSDAELIASGLRNSYDLAFNQLGDLFTFDSDMEYDFGAPWYRPTRICQIVSGAEFGWRAGAAKWPEYYEDSVRPVVNIGPSSPTGVLFGYDTKFPRKYKNALYALDWTFATLYAVHLEPDGAGYKADFEVFASGTGLPLTDAVVGKDGALYFCVGGRKLSSAIYRIWWDGPDSSTNLMETNRMVSNGSRDLRLSLESFHGKQYPSAIDKVWPYLGNEDPGIRYAARIALESQPVENWRNRVADANPLQTKLPALLALARQGSPRDLITVLDELAQVDVSGLSEQRLLLMLRVYERILGRGDYEIKEITGGHVKNLRPLLPHESASVNRELARILCYLQDASVIDPLLALMSRDQGQKPVIGADLVERNLRYGAPVMAMMQSAPLVERMHHAQMLLWIKAGWTLAQRKRYFEMIVDAIQTSKGGNGYQQFWKQILDQAKHDLSNDEKVQLEEIWAPLDSVKPLPAPQGPGRIWEMDYLLSKLENGLEGRDFENGKNMYAAATCLSCHVMVNEGGIAGPNLTSVAQRFTVGDVLESIILPSKAIADQYQLTTFALLSGETVTGRVISKDSNHTMIVPNVSKPSELRRLANAEIKKATPLPVSTMPPGLLNALNETEVLDLIAYIMAGGQSDHEVFQ